MMQKRNFIREIIFFGIVIVVLLLVLNLNNIIPTEKTNQTSQQGSVPETSHEQLLGTISHSLTLEKELPDNGEYVTIYKTIPDRYSRHDIITLGKKFNISSQYQIKEGAEGFSITENDKSAYVVLTVNGWIEYTNRNRARSVNPLDVPEKLPSDEEAVQIATKFLKDRDLLPDGAELIGIDHGKILGAAENGTNTIFWEDVQVWYGRKLNGIPVEGTQLMLAIGGNGDPIEFFTNWRKYESYKEMPLKTPEQAFEDLKVKGISIGMNNPDRVSINDMYLAYHTKPGAETEEYLEPIWMFKGEVIVNNKSVMQVNTYIPALTDEAVKSLSS